MKKQEKGITLTVLVITMLLMGIIVGTTFKLSNDNLNLKHVNSMYTDLESLKDSIFTYYNKYGTLPLGDKYLGPNDFLSAANVNDEADEYYLIDISKLENITLTRDLTWTDGDVYIINTKTHEVYYPEGVVLDEEVYYRLP